VVVVEREAGIISLLKTILEKEGAEGITMEELYLVFFGVEAG